MELKKIRDFIICWCVFLCLHMVCDFDTWYIFTLSQTSYGNTALIGGRWRANVTYWIEEKKKGARVYEKITTREQREAEEQEKS